MENRGREIIAIKNIIAQKFNKSDWLDLGYTIDCYDIIENHGRLLRSLSFGDEDYEGNILEVLTSIVKRNPDNIEKIAAYLAERYSAPLVSDFISTDHKHIPQRLLTFSPQVFQMPDKKQNENLVVVMLPFKLTDTFSAIKNSCEGLSIECKKADDIWENPTFIQDIFDLIFTCKVVIADFTGKNPNVFYEVGIAHTLGKIVVPITQSIDDVPSDLAHFRALKYLPNAQGYLELSKNLAEKLSTIFRRQPQQNQDLDLPF